ncbi:MAG TPA: response regulator transcription factor [Candidatus Marinimicrobia bacterium]|nr:response regulator transcription factor [Candidatus Neomarinimicrobiota bacterium]
MKIFIADDSGLLRQRIKRFISRLPDVRVCGEAGRISEAVNLIRQLAPEVIILDIQFPDGLGFEIYDRVISECYQPVTIILTNYPTKQYQRMCRDRNIPYFFDKTTDFEKINQVILTLAAKDQQAQEI